MSGDLVRLQRFLSQAGVAARRKAEELIVAGRVTVNGKIVRELGTKVQPLSDRVTVDGEAVMAEEHFYILFNKPKGCITAVRDDRGRPTVMDYLPNLPVSVAPVGRLDFYSEGVLLLTNDGDLAARLLAPKSHVPKTYHVKVWGTVSSKQLTMLQQGVRLEDGTVTQPAQIDELPAEGKHPWLQITLHEGKSRQIHRMLEALGHSVQKIQRVAFANLTFHGLRVGDARELTQRELNELRSAVGLDHSSVSRGRWKAKREDTDQSRRTLERQRVEFEAKSHGLPAPPPLPFDEEAEYTGPTAPRARDPRDVPRDFRRAPRDARPAARSDARPSRSDARPSRSDTRPSRSDTRPSRSDTRPSRSDTRPSRSDARPSRSDTRPSRSDARPSRGEARPSSRGPRDPNRFAPTVLSEGRAPARPESKDSLPRPASPRSTGAGRPASKPRPKGTKPERPNRPTRPGTRPRARR